MSGPPAQRPLCILSVGRSGTSLAGRMLEALGVDFGPAETMLTANDWNPQGFWEQRAIMDLNDEILAALGGTLWEPPALAPGWEATSDMRPFVDRVRALVEETFDTARPWGFKDPRTALTLPLWRAAIGPMDYVLCTRTPLEAIVSLHAGRPEWDPDQLCAFWLQLSCEALRHTRGERRMILPYESWFDDARATAEGLAVFSVGREIEEAVWNAMKGHFQPSLRRRRAPEVQLGADGDLPVEVTMLDVALRVLAARPEPALEDLASSLDAQYEVRRDAASRAREARAALERRLNEAESERVLLEGRLNEAQSERALLESRLGSELEQAGHELDLARAALAEREAALAAIKGSVTWRLSAPMRALRHGRPRQALREAGRLLASRWRRRR